MILMNAGQNGPRVRLVDCMKDIHAQAQLDMQKKIDERVKNKIPLDDSVNWDDVCELQKKLTEAISIDDSVRVNEAARKMVEHTSGALAPVPKLEIPEGAEDVELVFKVLSYERKNALSAIDSECWAKVRAARKDGDDKSLVLAIGEVMKSRTGFLLEAVESVFGIEGHEKMTPGLADGLARAGLLSVIYEAALYFQDLPPKKALRFGIPRESISQSMTATDVQSSDVNSLVAMAARENQMGAARFFTGPNGRPISVQNAT